MKDKNYILITQSLIHTIMQSLISLLSHKGQNGAGVLVGGEQKAAPTLPNCGLGCRRTIQDQNFCKLFADKFNIQVIL